MNGITTSLPFASYKGYDVIVLPPDMRLSVMPSLTPQLAHHIQAHFGSIVLDMSAVHEFDSSTIRLLHNVKKRLDGAQRRLFILQPSPELQEFLKEFKLEAVFAIVGSGGELQEQVEATRFQTYSSYTYQERGVPRLRVSCPVCGSKQVAGYLVDQNRLTWKWEQYSLFPSCFTKSGSPFEYFGQLPVVCLECCFSSVELDHWNLIESSERIREKSNLDDHSKMLLAKAIKKRHKMIESGRIATDTFFLYPRELQGCYRAIILAECCARSIAINNAEADLFEIGYLNYLALRYAPAEDKPELISNSRTWLTQAVRRRESYNHLQIAQAHFILLADALSLKKTKEATQVFAEFSEFMKTLGHQDEGSRMSSPQFWFRQADMVWHNEIAKKSSMLQVS